MHNPSKVKEDKKGKSLKRRTGNDCREKHSERYKKEVIVIVKGEIEGGGRSIMRKGLGKSGGEETWMEVEILD